MFTVFCRSAPPSTSFSLLSTTHAQKHGSLLVTFVRTTHSSLSASFSSSSTIGSISKVSMKWTTEEQFKLLRTALICNPSFKINAKAVAEVWPAEKDGERPTERAVKERFRAIMASAHDVQSLRQTEPSPSKAEKVKDTKDTSSVLSSAPPATPSRKGQAKAPNSTAKTPTGGSKRNRRDRPIFTSDAEMGSDAETSSGSETQLAPTPPSTRTLRVRKAGAAAAAAAAFPTTGEDSDKESDASTQEYGDGYSDEEYDFEEERRKKAAKKAKEAKLAARRASRASRN
ncbi:hypothetical protein PV04_04052 [Phialophora macrospora]|uniref:Uncharacterized protein n=1 Tax=Phialophora macrospora TaxID=1851006 RepID=A0A0D2G863_9EURO|nr:hypothetical protein PV04_04052 [Phialophora macrospora]